LGYVETNTPECIELPGTNSTIANLTNGTEYKFYRENLNIEIVMYDPEVDSVNVSELDCY
jgi:hypothetical protein